MSPNTTRLERIMMIVGTVAATACMILLVMLIGFWRGGAF